MREMRLLALLCGLLTPACAPEAADPCAEAANAWTECTGAVPASFDQACAERPELAAEISGMSCDALDALSSVGKADGLSSVFDRWSGAPVRPANFDQVSPGVYRGEHLLTNAKVRYLTAAPRGVKTVLDLEMYNPEARWERVLVGWNGLTFLSRPMLWNRIYDAQLIDGMVADLGNPANQPIYVHCYWGYDRTGLIVALHRVVNQHEAPLDAFRDWKAHMPGADRCAGFPELNDMFNRKVRELKAAHPDDARYEFQIDTPSCANQ